MRNPARPARWFAIIACFFMACAVQATTTKPAVHRHGKRTAHAAYRTVRYAPQGSSTTPKRASHRSSANKTHHYTHRRYARRSRYHHHVVLPKGPTSERITQIQSALARGGYYTGDPTGKWDSDTIAAVQKFQSANNIDATGKLDAPTLQKLGLGSDIAGVAAPKPVVPAITGSPANGAPSAPPSGAPGEPAGSANSSGNGGHVQSAAATPGGVQGSHAASGASTANSTGANAGAANSANSGGGASGASAIAPSTTSTDSGASDPASAAKPAASQH